MRLQNRDKDLETGRLRVLLTCPEIIVFHHLTGSELQTKISRRYGREGRSSLYYWFSYSIKGSKCCHCVSVKYLNNWFIIKTLEMSFYWRVRRPKWVFLQIQKHLLWSLFHLLSTLLFSQILSLIVNVSDHTWRSDTGEKTTVECSQDSPGKWPNVTVMLANVTAMDKLALAL